MATTPLLISILEIHHLSSGAHRALIALLSFRNASTGRCCPKTVTLAERLGVPYGTVRRWLRELRLAGIVQATQRRGSNSYQIELLKNCRKTGKYEPEACPKVDTLACPKVDTLACPKVDTLKHPVLIEQTERNRQRGTDAADVKVQALCKPVQKAAAAANFASLSEPKTTPVALAEAEMIVAELMPQHPEPGNEAKAVAEAAKILASNPEEMAATIETMRQTHAACRLSWANFPAGRFIPQLQRWFRDGDWKYLRPERREVQRETYDQRRRREAKQEDDEMYRMYAELDMWDSIRAYGGDEAVEVWRERVKQAS